MKTRMLTTAAALALWGTLPAVPSAQADIIEVCRAHRGGLLYSPLGRKDGQCRKRDTLSKIEQVEGTDVIASWLGGDVELFVGFGFPNEEEDCHLVINNQVDLYLLAEAPQESVWFCGGDSPVECSGGSNIASVREPENAAVVERVEFLTEAGFHIVIEDALLTWDFGEKDGCYGRATVSVVQR